MTNEQAIEYLSESNEAIEIAIQALEKQQYFRNCKDCNYYDPDSCEGFCYKFELEDVSGELDGCTFGRSDNE